VAQMWVHPDYRRRGIGTALLDAARAHAVYAMVVGKEALAFSAPTAEGYALAKRYVGEGGGGSSGKKKACVLVY
jgi:ribosomal protein S18 acetylase RimI-like enzyme